ncbi:sensor histidine kinase [Spartinivicinus poritis]|uniref:histidine kinase n=1 Tax=Spartinivicinus poritis TaxID=2994640 RepID=A0ABT5UKW1_9GAMM|nr:ATP-binding protein [Spartinivicinus sp. A2-2]MDE1465674.1 ATP-binding protein [Spartinivicinus sp. A2-2]
MKNNNYHLLYSIFEAAPVGLLMVDQKGAIVLANSNALELFQYKQDELIEQSVEILIPVGYRRDHPTLRKEFYSNLESRSMGKGRDLKAIRKDGSTFFVEIGLNPLTLDNKLMVVASIVDTTQRKEEERKLRQLNEALEKSNIELQQFAYVASHDLQTPLRGITGFAQLLEKRYKEKLGESGNLYIDQIVLSVKKMKSLINGLLAYSRVDAQSVPHESVCLQRVLDDTLNLLDMDITKRKAKINYSTLPQVLGCELQLLQLMENLLSNSIKYNQSSPPEITIACQEKNSEWVISIKDNGIGISEKHYKKIFEIFKRLHTHEQYPGTGIGLAVCRRIVNRHGGKIWVESEVNKGSVFYFTLAQQGKVE